MFAKLDNYKGVIIFYLLLVIILVALSYRSKTIDIYNFNQTNYSYLAK